MNMRRDRLNVAEPFFANPHLDAPLDIILATFFPSPLSLMERARLEVATSFIISLGTHLKPSLATFCSFPCLMEGYRLNMAIKSFPPPNFLFHGHVLSLPFPPLMEKWDLKNWVIKKN